MPQIALIVESSDPFMRVYTASEARAAAMMTCWNTQGTSE